MSTALTIAAAWTALSVLTAPLIGRWLAHSTAQR